MSKFGLLAAERTVNTFADYYDELQKKGETLDFESLQPGTALIKIGFKKDKELRRTINGIELFTVNTEGFPFITRSRIFFPIEDTSLSTAGFIVDKDESDEETFYSAGVFTIPEDKNNPIYLAILEAIKLQLNPEDIKEALGGLISKMKVDIQEDSNALSLKTLYQHLIEDIG